MTKKDLRDDFPESVKTQLAKRVGYRCSRPDCQKSTSGPSLSTPEAVNMGVAAHITAASPGGARYDPALTPEQRRSYDNGIWLCNYCATLVDKDEVTYPVHLLRDWKTDAEKRAGTELHRLSQIVENESFGLEQQNRLSIWLEKGKTRWTDLVAKDLANEKPSRFKYGRWIAAYNLTRNLDRIALSDLISVLRQAENHRIGYSGYAVWAVTDGHFNDLYTYPYYDVLECWMGKDRDLDAVYSHFWRASPEGYLFFLRGYQEDCTPDEIVPGSIIWIETPISDVTEILLHCQRLAAALGDKEASVSLRLIWEGLTDRNLSSRSLTRPRLERGLAQRKIMCHQSSAFSEITLSVKDICIKENLPTMVETITKPLYQSFNLYEPPISFIREEVAEMLKDGE